MKWSDVGPDDIARVRALADRRLTLDEWNAYVNQPMTLEEREEIGGLLDWFQRRYPTAAERLAYARRAYARWQGK